jgi:hypothetical protein
MLAQQAGNGGSTAADTRSCSLRSVRTGKDKKQSKSYRKIPQDHESLVSGGCARCPAVEHSAVQGTDSLPGAVNASEGSAGANGTYQVVPKKVDERLTAE